MDIFEAEERERELLNIPKFARRQGPTFDHPPASDDPERSDNGHCTNLGHLLGYIPLGFWEKLLNRKYGKNPRVVGEQALALKEQSAPMAEVDELAQPHSKYLCVARDLGRVKEEYSRGRQLTDRAKSLLLYYILPNMDSRCRIDVHHARELTDEILGVNPEYWNTRSGPRHPDETKRLKVASLTSLLVSPAHLLYQIIALSSMWQLYFPRNWDEIRAMSVHYIRTYFPEYVEAQLRFHRDVTQGRQ